MRSPAFQAAFGLGEKDLRGTYRKRFIEIIKLFINWHDVEMRL